MYWKNLSKKSESYFQRKTGVKKKTFETMVQAVKEEISKRPTKRGKEPKYKVEDQILIMLHYYRDYPTFFHLRDIYNIHESTAQRIVIKMEDILIKSQKFSLPKKEELHQLKQEDIVIIDVIETPIERPKKTKEILFRQKEKAYPKNPNLYKQKDQKRKIPPKLRNRQILHIKIRNIQNSKHLTRDQEKSKAIQNLN